MIIKSYTEVSIFLRDNLAFLEQEEAANNLIIGLLMNFKSPIILDNSLVLIAVFKEDKPVLVCIQTPPRNLLMYSDASHQLEAIDTLTPFLIEQKVHVPGIVAEKSLALDFVKQWAKVTQKSWKIIFNQLIYRLDKLEKIDFPKGKLRLITHAEMDLVEDWMDAFLEEAMNKKNKIEAKQLAKKHIEGKTLYVWENGEVVTMTAVHRPTRHGITVSYVYTPPKFRKKGYASACVAQVSALMLEKYDFCSLFTDLANPTSNKIYAKMGYEVVKEFRMINFLEE